MNKEIIKKRIKAIRQLLKKQKIDCFIITKPANVTYTTGFSGEDSWAVITAVKVYLLTDSRFIEQAQGQCPYCQILERKGRMAELVAKLIIKLKSVKKIAVEKSTSIADVEQLKKSVKARLAIVANIIESVRTIKDDSEVAAIEAAAKIAGKVLKQIKRRIKPGITENELAGLLDFQIRKLGARNSFETIVAFGPNASRPHHQPGTRKLKKNDTVLIDFGVKYKNYCCDITRCFAIGQPSTLYKKVYTAVEEAQQTAIKKVRAGVKITEVDAAARQVIKRHNFPVYGHGTGHGLGLQIHEGPVVAAKVRGKLKAGHIITIEPGVYIPGKLGVRIEDDILVTDKGYEILSRTQ